jgi:hypothetical protein
MGEWRYGSTHKNPVKSFYDSSDGDRAFNYMAENNTDRSVQAVTNNIATLNNSAIIRF